MALSLNGTSGISGVDGSAGTPALQGSDTNTGISFGTDTVNINTDGTTRATVDSSGRVLVGTSTAAGNFFNGSSSTQMQIGGSASLSLTQGANDAFGSYCIFAKSRSSGNTIVQSGDQIGLISFQGNDGSEHVEAATIQAVVDGTPGANDMPGRLVFSTTADGASSPTERMRISNAGGVFVNGTTSPVSGNPSDGIHTGSGGGHLADTALTLGDGLASARWRLTTGGYHLNFYQNNGSGTYVSRAYVTNSTGAYVAVSDSRAKKDIVDADYGIDTLKQLRPVSYLMKDQDETTARRNLGFIAQEVLGVIPEAVNVPADPEQMYGLESSALIPVLVSSLQQAVAKIEQLEAKVFALESA